MTRPPQPVDEIRNDLDLTQARHELHRALDFGGDAEVAAWARKWGEAALKKAAEGVDAEEGSNVTEDGPNWPQAAEEAEEALTAAKEKVAAATASLTSGTVDLSGLAHTLRGLDRDIDNAIKAVSGE